MMSSNREQALDPVISWVSLTFYVLFKSPVMGGNTNCLLKLHIYVCLRSIQRENMKLLCLQEKLAEKTPFLLYGVLSI